MSREQEAVLKTQDDYQYGFHDEDVSVFKTKKGLKPGKFSLTTVLPTFRTVSKPKLSRAVTYITAASEPDTR